MRVLWFLASLVILLTGCVVAPLLSPENQSPWFTRLSESREKIRAVEMSLSKTNIGKSKMIKNWRMRYGNDLPTGGALRDYVPDEEQLKSWTEMISLELMLNKEIVLEKRVATQNAVNQRFCPGTVFTTIKSDTHNIYYMSSYPPCEAYAQRSEIGRAAVTDEGFYRVSYIVQGRELTQKERDEWLISLRELYFGEAR